ncbi:hypothetical protein DFP72DRAFT_830377, partial [Ephemerocybe angulata]
MRATVQSTSGDVAFDCDSLLDSGASQCYVDKDYALSAGLTLRKLAHPVPAYNADGTENVAGTIDATVVVNIRIGAHIERLTMFVTKI